MTENYRNIINAKKLANNFINTVISSKQAVLVGLSMLPHFDPAIIDILFFCPSDKYEVGDTIIFQDKTGAVGISVHRIIKIDKKNKSYITKGDNVCQSDKPITGDMILGRVEKCRNFNTNEVFTIKGSKYIAVISSIENRIFSVLKGKSVKFPHQLFYWFIKRRDIIKKK